MSTPQQFLESFFRERLEIYADANVRLKPVYAKYFGEPLSERAGDLLLLNKMSEVIDDVKESANSAAIITSIKSERLAGVAIRARYHLAAAGEDWKITRIDRECFSCRGTGKSGQLPCQHCGGDGWIDRAIDAERRPPR
jgi:hypothetical protein